MHKLMIVFDFVINFAALLLIKHFEGIEVAILYAFANIIAVVNQNYKRS